jgi:hypothetical protein
MPRENTMQDKLSAAAEVWGGDWETAGMLTSSSSELIFKDES